MTLFFGRRWATPPFLFMWIMNVLLLLIVFVRNNWITSLSLSLSLSPSLVLFVNLKIQSPYYDTPSCPTPIIKHYSIPNLPLNKLYNLNPQVKFSNHFPSKSPIKINQISLIIQRHCSFFCVADVYPFQAEEAFYCSCSTLWDVRWFGEQSSRFWQWFFIHDFGSEKTKTIQQSTGTNRFGIYQKKNKNKTHTHNTASLEHNK